MSKQDLTTKLAATEASLKRWQTRLKRAANMVNELDRKRRRYQLELLQPKDAKPVAIVKVKKGRVTSVTPVLDELRDAGLKVPADDLPDFLNRADPLIAEEMTRKRKEAEQEERRKMPLSGRAAALRIMEKDGKKKKGKARRDETL